MRRARLHAVIAALIAAATALAPHPAAATPVYSAREGRACDNCHLRPNRWTNPELLSRKCTMSCQSCHVDPAGGGMRNAVGRFYGSATLPMIATAPRPTQDWNAWIFGFLYRKDRATTFTDSLPEGPPDWSPSRDLSFAPRDSWAIGHPRGGQSKHALLQGREHKLNSDPMLRASWDVRSALLISQQSLFFPMQADFALAFHPMEHVTGLANVGARGRSAGVSQTLEDARTPYLREGYLLLHEAPGGAYLKAGRFVPSFGLRIEDHTSQNRRTFEQDGSLPDTRVTGVEIGANPNYPFVSASYFTSTSRARVPSAFDIFDADLGRGMAINLGYRDMGWSAGGSALLHRRPLEEGGDATGVALYGSLNPWFYRHSLPLTYQAEYDWGRYERESGRETGRVAFYNELDWRVGNGVNLLLEQDWADPDTKVVDDEAFRVTAGIQLTPIPGVTLDMRVRSLFPATGQSGADLFTQIHLWR